MVTHFAKTPFTPAGVDVDSKKEGLGEETLGAIMAGMGGVEGEAFGTLVQGLEEVGRG